MGACSNLQEKAGRVVGFLPNLTSRATGTVCAILSILSIRTKQGGLEMVRMQEMIRWTTGILPLVALGLGVTGCATIRAHQAVETEQILDAAGFQVKPADTPEELARLQTQTPRKVVRDVRDGQPRYVYADPETCKCSYVGDEQSYQKFQELKLQKRIADEQMSAAHANWEASMNWWGTPWGW